MQLATNHHARHGFQCRNGSRLPSEFGIDGNTSVLADAVRYGAILVQAETLLLELNATAEFQVLRQIVSDFGAQPAVAGEGYKSYMQVPLIGELPVGGNNRKRPGMVLKLAEDAEAGAQDRVGPKR